MTATGQLRPIRRALISVHDKAGVEELARGLSERGVDIVSTGGTAGQIRSAGIEVVETSDLTGFRELLGGRVKSLHPALHAAILAHRDSPADMAELDTLNIRPIDLVVVHFYPFGQRSREHAGDATELIDIGGPALVRSAAKNHDDVTVITSPGDYRDLLDELACNDGCTSLAYRRRCAARAFGHTASYDSAVAAWHRSLAVEDFPDDLMIGMRRSRDLSYGENPHQRAVLYSSGQDPFTQHAGKPLGYNNLLDADAAMSLASGFDTALHAACVIVKHGTPCGAATATTPAGAFDKAWKCDSESAFGGVVAMNHPLDAHVAETIAERFVEVVVTPGMGPGAVEALQRRPGIRLLECASGQDGEGEEIRSINGALLVQDRDHGSFARENCRTSTEIEPSEAQWIDLELAWRVAKHARSNAVVIAGSGSALGIGSGQTSRVAAARMAVDNIMRHHRQHEGLVAASDGFFPFPDAVETLADAGVSAIIQPGGSRNDEAVTMVANRLGLAMVLTGRRSFRH